MDCFGVMNQSVNSLGRVCVPWDASLHDRVETRDVNQTKTIHRTSLG
jgi:hypothetical protein